MCMWWFACPQSEKELKLRVMKMCKYETIIYWSEEDQAFIAEVPMYGAWRFVG